MHLSRNRPRINGHSVIPTPRTTRTQYERAASSVWLSRTLLHPIMSEPADAGGTSAAKQRQRWFTDNLNQPCSWDGITGHGMKH